MDNFESILSVTDDDLELELRGACEVPLSDFILNPRRLRGSDFLMRWSQGVWSEHRLMEAVNDTTEYIAVPYGPSGTAPANDPRAFELYFERLEKANLGRLKRPDFLIFPKREERAIEVDIRAVNGVPELPFTSEDDPAVRDLLTRAALAVECENSLWRATQMPDHGCALSPQRRLEGKLGLKKTAIVPTIIIKEEDQKPLCDWQERHLVPIHVWHAFYDLAFGLSLDEARRLVEEGLILPTEQIFQAPSGATTTKTIFKFYYHYAYPLGQSLSEPTLVAEQITDKNGHILPYVRFEGGRFKLGPEVLKLLATLSTNLK